MVAARTPDTDDMRSLIGGLVVGAALVLGACGGGDSSSETDGGLSGIRRTPPLMVAGVSADEIAPGSGPMELVAASPDRLLVVYFGYTNCPDICPTTFAALRTALQDLGDDAERLDIAFVTVDPDRDTAEVMTGYLDSFFGDRWHALRAADAEALKVVERPFLASSSVETTFDGRIAVTHTGTTYVVDATGEVVVEWGFPTEPEDMTADLRTVLEDLS